MPLYHPTYMHHLPVLVGALGRAGPVAGHNLTADRWGVSAPSNEELGRERIFISKK